MRRLRKSRRIPSSRLVRRRSRFRPRTCELRAPPYTRRRTKRPGTVRIPSTRHPECWAYTFQMVQLMTLFYTEHLRRRIGKPTTPPEKFASAVGRRFGHGGENHRNDGDHRAGPPAVVYSEVDGDGGSGVWGGGGCWESGESGDGWWEGGDGGGVIGGDAVVLAIGPWSSKFSLLSSIFSVNGLKAHSLVLEPKEINAITAHALFLSYQLAHGGQPIDPEIYPRPTGEVYVCGMSSEEEVPDDPNQIEPNPDSIRVLKRVAGMVSSHLGAEARVKAEQACFLPCTDDNIPVIGEIPGMAGCFVATGHSCWGILNGPATGAAMAELVMDGGSTIVDLTPFSPTRFVGRIGKRR
ncbi:hypothetical protein L6452_44311 [Arctium lappa]|uniref:Uncharacterized protein n=1 Tax=Arctium lappa TaxID=4217 RepID=A0ACB8XGH6_ARCLA|nr:hypothetical protein L6452_44311 [Arctium lappa]